MKLEAKNSGIPNLSRRKLLVGGAGLAVASVLGGLSGCGKSGDIKANIPFSIATDPGGGEESAIKGKIQKGVDRIIDHLSRVSTNPWNKVLSGSEDVEFREDLIKVYKVRIDTLPGKNNIDKLTIEYSGITYTCYRSILACKADKPTTLKHLKDALEELTRLL